MFALCVWLLHAVNGAQASAWTAGYVLHKGEKLEDSIAYGKMAVMKGSVVGGTCEYADAQNGGLQSPAATSPYIASGQYCGAHSATFASGAGCGACFHVTYDGSSGTDPGRAGSAVVQVVTVAESVEFACNADVFENITGAKTGIFPISFKPVACDTSSDLGVATVLDGNNAWYTKAIFSDLPHAVAHATLIVRTEKFSMQRVGGATFMANMNGSTGAASFELSLADGSTTSLTPCFNKWPVSTGTSCTPSAFSVVV